MEKYSLAKHLSIVGVVVFAFLGLFNYLDILPYWINLKFIFVLAVGLVTWFFAERINQVPEKQREKRKDVYLYGQFFLLGLIIIALNQFLKRQIIIDWLFEISVFTIAFGFLTFFASRDRVEREIESEKDVEEKAEKKRGEEFSKKFPRINKVWGLRSFVKWMYKEGWWYVLALILILVLFTAIKVPYMGLSFTGEHSMKYNAYVEPAKYMAESNNPLLNQKKYLANPVEKFYGKFNTFGNLPFMEWGLFLTYEIFQNNSLELNTRMFANLLGLSFLFFFYIFFKFWAPKKLSLLATFFLSINPIISFSSFVTNLDILILLLMVLSLIQLNFYIKNKNFRNLFFAGLLFGIGNSIKYSLFLWMAPISIILLWFRKKDFNSFVKESLIYISLSLLPIFTFRTSIRYLPSHPAISFFTLCLWIAFYILFFKEVTKKEKKLESFLQKLISKKTFLFTISAILLFLAFFFLKFMDLSNFFEEFLTDFTLLFKYELYRYMLIEQFKKYLTAPIFNFGLLGLTLLFFIKNKKIKIISISFLGGSLFYWVIASKIIFFHNYYATIIMITFCFLAAILTYVPFKHKNYAQRILLVVLIILIVFPSSYSSNIDRLSKDKEGFLEASEYLIQHSPRDSFYIDESYTLSLTIRTGIGRVGDYSYLENPTIKQEIREEGFAETMHKYKIFYLITTSKEPNYEKLINIFAEETLKSNSYRRTDIILSELDKNYNYFSDIKLRKELIEKYNLKDKFQLEKTIGDYNFFVFQN